MHYSHTLYVFLRMAAKAKTSLTLIECVNVYTTACVGAARQVTVVSQCVVIIFYSR